MHRDIKCDNIIFSDENCTQIKLIDFGNSAHKRPGKFLKDLTGTALYMAPEVINRKYNEKCDVWSIGVMLYRMISGHYPFHGEIISETHY